MSVKENTHQIIKKQKAPETVVGKEDGSSKRNILRKNSGPPRERKNGSTGKNIDDGSMYADSAAVDAKDPNYDSEEGGDEFLPRFGSLHREDIAKSRLTLTAFKKIITPPIQEFFVSGDFDEMARSLVEIDAPAYAYEFVKRLINMSLDKMGKERELVSQLLSSFYPDVLSSSMIGKGFERLFELVDEIEIDCPPVRSYLATYLARAVLDECLPPSFLGDAVVCNLGGDIVDQAKLMLSRDHSGARLEKSWGPGDGRPTRELKVAVDQCMQEYMTSGDIEEASSCIAELNAPFFSHEVVKRAVVNAMDKDDATHDRMSDLLKALYDKEICSGYQVSKGFESLRRVTPDLILDNPSVEKIIAKFRERAEKDGILSLPSAPEAQSADIPIPPNPSD